MATNKNINKVLKYTVVGLGIIPEHMQFFKKISFGKMYFGSNFPVSLFGHPTLLFHSDVQCTLPKQTTFMTNTTTTRNRLCTVCNNIDNTYINEIIITLTLVEFNIAQCDRQQCVYYSGAMPRAFGSFAFCNKIWTDEASSQKALWI